MPCDPPICQGISVPPIRRSLPFWYLLIAFILVSARYWHAYLGDLQVYLAGGRAILTGLPLYGPDFPASVPGTSKMPFTYPPFAAMLFAILTPIPQPLVNVLFTAGSIGALFVVCRVVLVRLLPGFANVGLLAGAATLAACALEPMQANFYWGQINIFLLALVILDCVPKRTRWPRGVLVGLAAAIKLTPLVFLLYFAAKRDWRAAGTTLATFTGTAVLGYLLSPANSASYWLHTLFNANRIGRPANGTNQSLKAVIARMDLSPALTTTMWVMATVVVLALTLLLAIRYRRQKADLTALIVVANAGLLVSPVSWAHHWVWIAPALLVLIHHVRTRPLLWPLAALPIVTFMTGIHNVLPLEGMEVHWTTGQRLLGNGYVWLALGLLIVLVLTTARQAMTAAGGTPVRIPEPRCSPAR
ncbi:DUF2029 domain-containing protein [Pseudonocardiaceae bacterium YIM PH 21723]|nr:DUF2029 domain-containing protein [Pseudonocardiaceae bacterium YIM PH 21723]